jgi:hypothetical protein
VGLTTISKIWSKHLPNLEKSCGGHPAKLSAADIDYTKLNMQRNKIKTAVQAAKVLQNANGESISAKPICRGLRKSGWRARRKVKGLHWRRDISRLDWSLQRGIWSGLWMTGRSSGGQMRLKSIGLGQMGMKWSGGRSEWGLMRDV